MNTTQEKTEAQLAYDARFLAAIAYGNKIKVDPVLAPLYELVCTGRMRAYHAGLRDFLKPPVIEAIDLSGFTGKSGGTIRVVAWDDFQVIQLTVIIRNAANQEILEQGSADWAPLQRKWVYTAHGEISGGTSLSVEATATDRPGNQGVARVLHLVS